MAPVIPSWIWGRKGTEGSSLGSTSKRAGKSIVGEDRFSSKRDEARLKDGGVESAFLSLSTVFDRMVGKIPSSALESIMIIPK